MKTDYGGIDVFCNICLTKMDQTEPDEWICPNCSNRAFLENPKDADSIYYEHNSEDIYDDAYENDTPEGCIACGNPAYPNCIDCCNLTSD